MQLWLARRQVRHVGLHRGEVPPHFADRITLGAHRKAADYTIARTRLSMVDTIQDAVVLLALTLGGGLAAITAWSAGLPASPLWRDVALVVAVTLITVGIGLYGLTYLYPVYLGQVRGYDALMIGEGQRLGQLKRA